MSYALITGASKGIGKAIAEKLAEKKFNLLLIARSEELLIQLSKQLASDHGIECRYLSADLSDESSVARIIEYVKEHKLDVSVLVNNAGYALWGRVDEADPDAMSAMMRINMLVPVRLTRMMLPLLKRHKAAYILNVASTSAYQAVPTLSIYAAAKSFMVLFSRALRIELKKTSVSVTCLSPGPTDTYFMDAAGMTTPEMKKRAAKFNMKPEDVAKFAVNGMFRKRNEIIPGFVNRVSVALTYFVPKSLTEKIAEGLYK